MVCSNTRLRSNHIMITLSSHHADAAKSCVSELKHFQGFLKTAMNLYLTLPSEVHSNGPVMNNNNNNNSNTNICKVQY